METHLNGLRRTAVRLYISPSTQIKPVPMSILLSVTKECRRLLRSSFLLYEWIVVSGKWQIGRRLLRSFLLTQTRSSDCCQNHSVTAETRNKKQETRNKKQETRTSTTLSHRRNQKQESRNKKQKTTTLLPPQIFKSSNP